MSVSPNSSTSPTEEGSKKKNKNVIHWFQKKVLGQRPEEKKNEGTEEDILAEELAKDLTPEEAAKLKREAPVPVTGTAETKSGSKSKPARYVCPEHDWRQEPNFVTDEEKKMVEELRTRLGDTAKEFTNKSLLIFLFARKYDMDRAVDLVTHYADGKKKYNLPARVPLSVVNQKLVESGFVFMPRDSYDNEGRIISYLLMAKFIPADYPDPKDFITYMFWVNDYFMEREPIHAWRHGLVYIESIAGMGLKNMGGSGQKELMKMIQNTFPIRIARIIVVNPGTIVRILLKFASLFMKAKIMQRVVLTDSEGLFDLVPRKAVVRQFGGEREFDFQADLEAVRKEEAEAEAKAKEPASPLASPASPASPAATETASPPATTTPQP